MITICVAAVMNATARKRCNFRFAGHSGRMKQLNYYGRGVPSQLRSSADWTVNEDYVNFERLQISALRRTMLSCILFVAAPIGVLAQTVTIHVRVLDGHTGKNLSGMYLAFVDYRTDPDGKIHADLNGRTPVTTSVDGDLYVANPDVRGVLVFNGLGNVNGDWVPCTRQKLYDSGTRTYGNEHLYPVSTIVATGLVAKNSCSRRTATAKPGELVIFVRRATWWEKFIWGMES
jgi:hypothetical protein